MVKNPPTNAGNVRDVSSTPGSGRSLEKVMATHSSILAWRIPWREEPGRLQSMRSESVRHDWSGLACFHTCSQFFSFFLGYLDFPCGSAGKESSCNVGDLGSIPGSGRSPGERKGYPLQYSGLENSMDCIVHGVAKSQTQLSDLPRVSFCPLQSRILTEMILIRVEE